MSEETVGVKIEDYLHALAEDYLHALAEEGEHETITCIEDENLNDGVVLCNEFTAKTLLHMFKKAAMVDNMIGGK